MWRDAPPAETDADARPPQHFGDPPAEYHALSTTAGLADFSHRTQVELRGSDRAPFLHNLCTNEIRKLAVGRGTEAFLTNPQGKILAHVWVFCEAEALVLETVPGEAAMLLAHLDRYLIREDVQLVDRSADRAELLLAGPDSTALLAGTMADELPDVLLGHRPIALRDGPPVVVRRVDWTGPVGYLLSVDRVHLVPLWTRLLAAGAVPCGEAAIEPARIEAGTPWYRRDVTDQNLPQEIDRNERAISFVKGCYIGQETVARIDALGHVNKLLVRLKGGVPTSGPGRIDQTSIDPLSDQAARELSLAGRPVGMLTSLARIPHGERLVALGYVRREANTPHAQLESAWGPLEIVPPAV